MASCFIEAVNYSVMSNDSDHLDLIRQGQLGSDQAKDSLVRQAEVRVSAYIFRLTFDRDLTQDLLQESLWEMTKSLDK